MTQPIHWPQVQTLSAAEASHNTVPLTWEVILWILGLETSVKGTWPSVWLATTWGI